MLTALGWARSGVTLATKVVSPTQTGAGCRFAKAGRFVRQHPVHEEAIRRVDVEELQRIGAGSSWTGGPMLVAGGLATTAAVRRLPAVGREGAGRSEQN